MDPEAIPRIETQTILPEDAASGHHALLRGDAKLGYGDEGIFLLRPVDAGVFNALGLFLEEGAFQELDLEVPAQQVVRERWSVLVILINAGVSVLTTRRHSWQSDCATAR